MKDNINSAIANHKTKSLNFEFILNTKLEKYYEKLIDDEIIFSKKPTNEKIYIDCSVISEYIVDSVAMTLFEKNSNRKFDDYLKKLNGNIPDEIYKYLDQIKLNGDKYGDPNSKPYDVTVEQTFRAVHYCLLWYFKSMKLDLDEMYDVDFIIPTHAITGENEERYLNIIKQQKSEYEEKLEEAIKVINNKFEEIEKLHNDTENDVKQFNKILSDRNIKIKEIQIENGIIQSSLERENNNKELEELKKDLQKYKLENDLLNEAAIRSTKSHIDEVSEDFMIDEDINKIKKLRISISEELKNITKKIDETSTKIKSFKEILEEDSNIQFSKYPTFYKAFVKLGGEQLRKIYVTLDKLNIATLLITSIKNKFSKSDIDGMQKLIDNEANKLKLYSEEEIKFKLYYKLMKLCNISNGCIVNDKEFKGNLDKFVDFAYSTLEKKKDFKNDGNELETINAYYMNKIVYDFEKKFNDANENIQKELIDNIYNNFVKLPEDQKKQLYDKLNIKNASADAVKASMKTMGPTFMLSSFGVYTDAASLLSFLTGPFMIVLLLADSFFAYGQGKKQKADLVPMIIMQICVSEISLKNDNNYEEKYSNLVSAWKEERNNFEINNNMEIKISQEINELNENKSNLEKECSKETQILESLSLKFQQEKDSFKYILLTSPKRNSLKNYGEYDEYTSKLKTLTCKSSTNRGLGFFSKIVSKVKDGTKEFIIKKKINELESMLVLEGTQSEIFNSDTINIKQIEKQLVEKNITIIHLKSEIEEERKKINILKGKLTNVEIKMRSIKGEFFDIDSILT